MPGSTIQIHVNVAPREMGHQTYGLHTVTAVDRTSVALVTRLEVRSGSKECQGEEGEETSEHLRGWSRDVNKWTG